MTEVQEKGAAEVKDEVATDVVKSEATATPVQEVKTEDVEGVKPVEENLINEDESDEIEWHQTPKVKTESLKSEADPKITPTADLENLKSENQALTAKVQSLESQLASLMSDPLMKAYNEYLSSTDEPKPSEFLNRVGVVVNDPYAALQGTDLVKEFYTKKAQSLGLTGDDLEEAVQEELDTYETSTKIRKKELEAQAKAALTGEKKAASIEDLEKEFVESRKKQTEQDVKYLQRNRELINDFLNKAVEKGKFNGRAVDSKWKETILKGLENSFDVFNPTFVSYTEPDKDGISYLHAPDVVDFIDYAIFRSQLKSESKKKVDSAKVENLEEKAIAAHQAAIEGEKAAVKSNEKDINWFEAYETFNGVRHRDDPRGPKEQKK